MDAYASWAIGLSIVCNVTCALLGCFLLLRRMSLIGDAISHAVLPGIALAYFMTGQLGGVLIVLGAMLLGFLTAYLTQALHSSGKVTEDASMGIVFTSLFALGVLMVTRGADNADLDVSCVLSGKLILAVSRTTEFLGFEVPKSLFGMSLSLLLTLGFVLLFWKELKITSFDSALASSMGINAAVVHYLLMALVGGVTVASFEAVGSILVIAMLIVPAACAHLLTDRLWLMLVWAAVVAVLASVLGYFAAERFNTTEAGMMAVSAGGLLLLSVLFAPRHGVLSKKLRNWRLRLRIAGEDLLGQLYRREEAGGLTMESAEARGVAGRLALSGLVRQKQVERLAEGRVGLTDEGRRRALSLVRSHRLWEAYLDENVELPRDHLHDPAHRMEHFIDPEMQQELAREVRQADVDPHGRAIPRPGENPNDRR